MNGADDFKSGVIRIKPVMSHNSAQRRRELEISVGEIESPAVVDIFSLRLLLGPLDSWLDQRQQPALAYLIEENRSLRGQLRGHHGEG
jgi:hypothetical protein